MPSIDVFIPCYNAEKYIEKAIESVQKQQYTDFRMLIIDDGSTDRSVQIVQRLMKKDNRIVLLQNECNLGVQFTRNRGLNECISDYIAFMDADDIMPEYRLMHQMLFLEEHPECDILSGGMQTMTEDGNLQDIVLFGEKNSEGVYAGLFFENILPMGSCIVRRKFLQDRKISFDENFYTLEDYNFWTDCAIKHANMHIMNEVLQYYRIVSTGLSKTNSVSDKIVERNRCFDQIHYKMLKAYNIHLSVNSEKIFLKYTNEVKKSYFDKIRDWINFKVLLRELKRQVPFSNKEWIQACDMFYKKYYII